MNLLGLILAPVRLFFFLLHIIVGLFVSLLLFRFFNGSFQQGFIRTWSRGLLMILGVRLSVDGSPVQMPMRGLLVGNHSSWLDIFVANAVQPVRFIAKSEIRNWPILGALVTSAGTLYVERGNRHAINGTNREISEAASRGDLIGLYPEGTTTDGTHLLPFKSNLFQPAIDNGMQVYPLGVSYMQQGHHAAQATYAGDTSLMRSFWQIASSVGVTAHVCYGPAISAAQFSNRHDLAKAAQESVAHLVGQAVMARETHT